MLGCLAAALPASTAHTKTLLYCSQGSPEGFDPALYTTGTTFDASSRAIYNKLVEFERGGATVGSGLAESWSASDDGLEYAFNLRSGVKFHTTDFFTPTRDFNADDVYSRFSASSTKATLGTSIPKARPGNTSVPWTCST